MNIAIVVVSVVLFLVLVPVALLAGALAGFIYAAGLL